MAKIRLPMGDIIALRNAYVKEAILLLPDTWNKGPESPARILIEAMGAAMVNTLARMEIEVSPSPDNQPLLRAIGRMRKCGD